MTTDRGTSVDVLPESSAMNARSLSVIDLLVRFLHSLPIISAMALAAGVAVAGIGLLRPRDFEATAQLATISGSGSASASIAAALSGMQAAGVQATPALIVQLSRTNAVLFNVGSSISKELGGRRLVDLLTDAPLDSPTPDERIPEKMRARLLSSSDLQTGLIRFAVSHDDSAVARRVVIRFVDEVNKAYLTASQAQARAIAAAQSIRVDSAASRLARAETVLLEFVRANRATLPYSEAALGRTRLERERDFAQVLYGAAVNERDAAVSRALQNAPALIVVDPVPAKLRPKSRGLAVKAPLAMIAVFALSLLWIVGRMKLEALSASTSPSERRLAALFSRRRRAVT